MLANRMIMSVPSGYSFPSAVFDGTNDYVRRASNLSGISNSSVGSLSFFIRFNGGMGSTQYILTSGTNEDISVIKNTSDQIFIRIYNQNTGDIFTFHSSALSSGVMYAIQADWNVAFTAGSRLASLYINDVSDFGITNDTGASFVSTLDLANQWTIGASNAAGSKLNADLGGLWFEPTTRIGIDTESQRRKLVTAAGKPVNLGSDGSTPTGVVPKLFFKDPASTFNTNSGDGGTFTTTGTLTEGIPF